MESEVVSKNERIIITEDCDLCLGQGRRLTKSTTEKPLIFPCPQCEGSGRLTIEADLEKLFNLMKEILITWKLKEEMKNGT